MGAQPHIRKIATIPLARDASLRIALEGAEGARMVDVRICTLLAGGTGILAPTKRGVTVRPTDLPALIAGLQAAQEALENEGVDCG